MDRDGHSPLAGRYHTKAAFVAGTFAKLNRLFPHGAQLQVEHLLVKDDQAVVELHSQATASWERTAEGGDEEDGGQLLASLANP